MKYTHLAKKRLYNLILLVLLIIPTLTVGFNGKTNDNITPSNSKAGFNVGADFSGVAGYSDINDDGSPIGDSIATIDFWLTYNRPNTSTGLTIIEEDYINIYSSNDNVNPVLFFTYDEIISWPQTNMTVDANGTITIIAEEVNFIGLYPDFVIDTDLSYDVRTTYTDNGIPGEESIGLLELLPTTAIIYPVPLAADFTEEPFVNGDTQIATVNYNFYLGQDGNQLPWVPESVTLYDENNQIVTDQFGDDITQTDGEINYNVYSGQLSFPFLELGVLYSGYYIKLNSNAGDNTQVQYIAPFYPVVNTTTPKFDYVDVTPLAQSVEIDYFMNLGNDETGAINEISYPIILYDGNDQEITRSTNLFEYGTFTINDLDPGTTYNDWYLSVITSAGIIESRLFSFETLLLETTSSTPMNEFVDVYNITKTTVAVDYSFYLGTDEYGNYYNTIDPEPITVKNSNEVVDSSLYTNTLTTSENGNYAGTIYVENLAPNTAYSNFTISLNTDGDVNSPIIQVNPFITNGEEYIAPIINCYSCFENINSNSVIINYQISNFGQDISGNPYQFLSASLFSGTEIIGQTYTADVTGEFIIPNLDQNIIYDDFWIEAQFISTTDTTDIQYATTEIAAFETTQGEYVQTIDEINYDLEYNFLQVKGTIETNGSIINDIYLTNPKGEVLDTLNYTEETTTSGTQIIKYELIDFDYKDDLSRYTIHIEGTTNGVPVNYYQNLLDPSMPEAQESEIPVEYIPDTSVLNVPWVLITLIIVGVFLILAIAWAVKNIYFKKHNQSPEPN
ncbi:MAG: hypothetical protein GQ557_02650 [Mycoplasmataceae bacterium]|nr:hypothetical protein [Mycoplasmataceae bacterium]